MAPVTIRDVAKSADVSIATISRVLNASPAVRPVTRDKVLAAIAKTGYTPNLTARRLSTGRTLTIGIILPFLTLPSFEERLRGVQYALAETEYDLVLVSAETPNRIDRSIDNILGRGAVDGAIIVSLVLDDSQTERFIRARLPVVQVDAHRPELSRVLIDDVAGGAMATRHLIDLGHRAIAFLGDYLENPFNFVSMNNRFKGYRQALQEYGLAFNPGYHQEGQLGGREAFQKARALLTQTDRPTAIFAASDTHAVGVLKAAHELEISVPEELSVIGYDDLRDAEYLNLTTVRQHLFEIGLKGAQILLAAIQESPGAPVEARLNTEVIVRGTTAPPAR
jgi:DNA-binding LacI/PurR family transcriptional regulator